MMSILKNKKGMMTIYVLVFTTTMISLITAFISAAESRLVKESANMLGHLWATSILAEYDKELYSQYGIFAYYGDEGLVGDKLQTYVDYTYDEKRYANCKVTSVNIFDYSLIKTDNMRDQIMLVSLLEKLTGNEVDSRNIPYVRYDDGSGVSGSPAIITNERLINSLPSKGRVSDGLLDRAGDFLKSLTSVKDIVREGTEDYLVNNYILNKFRNVYCPIPGRSAYLYGEQEYIIAGRHSDESNRKAIRNRIIAMREIMNLVYLENNEAAQAAALAAGEALTAGMAGPEAAEAIIAAWALAESVNDYELLIKGKPVPVFKDESSWAIDIESILANEESGCVYTGNAVGDYYSDYIKYMLYLMDDDTRILRIMDLIQINMRNSYRSDFLISEHFVGVEYEMQANGEKYFFEDKYQ